MSLCACKQSLKSFLISNLLFTVLYYFLSDCYFLSLVSIFVTFRRNLTSYLHVPCFHIFLCRPLWHRRSPTQNIPHDHHIVNQYLLSHPFHLPLSLSLSLSASLSLSLFLSHIFGCLTPHTPFASLVSRTLATRTVMSSMRSWILQLWPPLPAHEALLSLALGILSSMQPSSLAHTSACHYRPFPSDFGLKVHRLMHSFSPVHPPLHMHRPPFYYAPHGSLVYLPLQVSAVFLISPSLLRQKVGSRLRIFSGCYFHSNRHERRAALWRNRDTMKPKSSLQFLRAIIRSAV